MVNWIGLTTIAFILTLLWFIFQNISANQARNRVAKFKLEQRRRAGIPDSDKRPFNIAQQDVKNKRQQRLQNRNQENQNQRSSTSLYPPNPTSSMATTTPSRRITTTTPSLLTPNPSSYRSSMIRTPNQSSNSKPSYAQLHLSRDDQQARITQQKLELESQQQRQRQRDPYNPNLQHLPLSSNPLPSNPRKSNKRSHESEAASSVNGDFEGEEEDEQGEIGRRNGRKNKSRRVGDDDDDEVLDQQEEEEEDDSMELDPDSDAQQQEQEDEDDEMDLDRYQVTSRGKKREIDELSTTFDHEESLGSRTSLLGDDELDEIPVRRGGARRLPPRINKEKNRNQNFSPRKKHKRTSLSNQEVFEDDEEEEEVDGGVDSDEEMKSVSTFKPSQQQQLQSPQQKRGALPSPSKRKLSTSNDREPGEEWQDYEGLRWQLGLDGKTRRLAMVRSLRKKYPNMPRDSLHPDKDLMEVVYLEKYLTGDEFEELWKKKELAGQELEREEMIRKKEKDERDERERREKEEQGRREGRRVKALGVSVSSEEKALPSFLLKGMI